MFGHFMLVFLRCAFSLFSSVAFLLRSFSFSFGFPYKDFRSGSFGS